MPSLRREQLAGMGLHYLFRSFDYFLKTQSELGFKTIEMWAGAPHFLVDDTWHQDCAEARKKVESYGLNVGIFTPECASYQYLICAWDKYAHDRALGYYKQGLHAAGQMGAKYMLTNCCGGDWNEEYERTFERAVNTLQELAPIAADNGVTLAVETVRPEESKVIITLPELKRLIDAVGHPNVKAALDTIAMGVAGESPEEWFRVLGSDIVHTHFVDGRPYGHLVWGDGLYPLDDFIQVLNDNHYEGYLGQEITDGRYYDDPAEADRRNMAAFAPYLR